MLVSGLAGAMLNHHRLVGGCTCTCQHSSRVPTTAQSPNCSKTPTAAKPHLHSVVPGLIEVLQQVGHD